MSWWTDVTGAVLGDGPADAVRAALARFAQHRDETGEPTPRAADLVSAVEVAVQLTLDLPDRPPLVARLDSGERLPAAHVAPDALVAALRTAFEAARTDYRSSWERDPTVAELAATVTFVLAPVADSVVELPESGTGLAAIEPG